MIFFLDRIPRRVRKPELGRKRKAKIKVGNFDYSSTPLILLEYSYRDKFMLLT